MWCFLLSMWMKYKYVHKIKFLLLLRRKYALARSTHTHTGSHERHARAHLTNETKPELRSFTQTTTKNCMQTQRNVFPCALWCAAPKKRHSRITSIFLWILSNKRYRRVEWHLMPFHTIKEHSFALYLRLDTYIFLYVPCSSCFYFINVDISSLLFHRNLALSALFCSRKINTEERDKKELISILLFMLHSVFRQLSSTILWLLLLFKRLPNSMLPIQ